MDNSRGVLELAWESLNDLLQNAPNPALEHFRLLDSLPAFPDEPIPQNAVYEEAPAQNAVYEEVAPARPGATLALDLGESDNWILESDDEVFITTQEALDADIVLAVPVRAKDLVPSEEEDYGHTSDEEDYFHTSDEVVEIEDLGEDNWSSNILDKEFKSTVSQPQPPSEDYTVIRVNHSEEVQLTGLKAGAVGSATTPDMSPTLSSTTLQQGQLGAVDVSPAASSITVSESPEDDVPAEAAHVDVLDSPTDTLVEADDAGINKLQEEVARPLGSGPHIGPALISAKPILAVTSENAASFWNTSPLSRPTSCTSLNFIEEKVEVMLGDTIDDDKETLPQSDSIQNLISSTMTLLGVQQSSTEVKCGSGNFLQDFQDHAGGSLGGRFNVELMEIQILFSNLESMVSVTGLGLKLDPNELVLVTLSACNSSNVVMKRLEKEECENMTSSGGAFYMIHFDVDIDEDHDHIMKRPQNSPPTSSESDSTLASDMELEEYKSGEEIAEDSSMYVACRVHTFAKLILLLGLKETRDVPLTKFKDFSLVWDWKDIEMALGEYEEEQKNIANYSSEQVNKRPSGYGGDNDSRGFRRASNLPSNNKGKAKCNQSGALYGGGNGMGGGGGDGGEDDDGFDPGHQRLLSSSSKSQEEKNYSIQVRPGCGCYQEDQNETSWPYKSIHVFATPAIIITFRNCFNRDSKEIHAKLGVNFDLANNSDPSASEKNRFAWYHDSFEFSIQCVEDRAAELIVNSGKVHNLEPVKSTVSSMTTRNSKSSQKMFSTELSTSALLPVKNKTKATYTRNGPSSSLASGETRENLNRETVQGFLAREKFEGGSKPRIGCAFTHAKSKDIESYIHEACGRLPDMEQYLVEDMCSSQAQVIEGAFRPLAENKHYYAYKFNCSRRIVGFFWAENITDNVSRIQKWKRILLCKADRSSIENIKDCTKVTCEQSFDVGLYINHGMKHIHKLAMECPDGNIPSLRGGEKHRRVLAADCLEDNNGQPIIVSGW